MNRYRYVLIAILACTLVACGDVKTKLVKGGSAAVDAIGVAQAADIAFCLPSPTDMTQCTSPLAAGAQYTSVVHQKVEGALSKALAGLDTFEAALSTWQPHTPLPAGITDVLATVQDAFTLLSGLHLDPKIQTVVSTVQAVVSLVQGILSNAGVSATTVVAAQAHDVEVFLSLGHEAVQ